MELTSLGITTANLFNFSRAFVNLMLNVIMSSIVILNAIMFTKLLCWEVINKQWKVSKYFLAFKSLPGKNALAYSVKEAKTPSKV
jgi:hypothetical protein